MNVSNELREKQLAQLPRRCDLVRDERQERCAKAIADGLSQLPKEVAGLMLLAYSALDAASDMVSEAAVKRGAKEHDSREERRLFFYGQAAQREAVIAVRDLQKGWRENV